MSEECSRCGRELKDEHAIGVTGGYVNKDEYFMASDTDPYIAIYCKKCWIKREDIIEDRDNRLLRKKAHKGYEDQPSGCQDKACGAAPLGCSDTKHCPKAGTYDGREDMYPNQEDRE
jgi:predicted nucleic-acid-binding Zn-ribbon protein